MRRAFAGEEDDADNNEPSSSAAPSSPSSGTFLQLHSPKEHSSAYSKGDLFILSTSPDLSPRRAGAVGDKLSAPWVAVAKANWHGPNAEGRLEVEILSCWQDEESKSQQQQQQQQRQRPFACLLRKGAVPVLALRACDAATDLACLAALSSSSSSASTSSSSQSLLARLRALPALISAPPALPPYNPAATGKAAADAEAHSRAAGLNEDQASVLEAAAAWVSASSSSGSPPSARPPAVSVIHGPFGSGKSSLLVALVTFLANRATEKTKGEEEEDGIEDGGDRGQRERPPRPSLPPGSGLRVLVVSHTNAAVDRVLTGLLDHGFDDIIRVGPLRRMSRALLPHSLHAAAASSTVAAAASSYSSGSSSSSSSSAAAASLTSLAAVTANATAELQAMLRDATTGARKSLGGNGNNGNGSAASTSLSSDAAAIAAELARVKAGAVRARAAALCRAAVVGTTCVSAGALPGMLAASLASSSSSSSAGNNKMQRGHVGPPSSSSLTPAAFDVAVVDEASQIAEPLAAVSLAAGGASYVIVAGDPMQLPPVVASPAAVTTSTSTTTTTTTSGNASSAPIHGLSRSLLARLIAAGHGARLLRSQYRCHPAISAVANAHFYSNKLVDGVGAEQRAPLVPWLPPLALVDVRSGAAEDFSGLNGGGSVSNRAEAAAVVRLVSRLGAAGVRSRSIGVICFFRSQVELVRRLLLENQAQKQQKMRIQQQEASAAPLAEEASKEVEEEAKEEEDVEVGDDDDDDEIPTVATVDSYQGCEKDLIIITTAVTRPSAFIRDASRVNVAITRSRRHLVVVGLGGALTAPGGGGPSNANSNSNALGAIVRACAGIPGGVLEMV